MKDSERTTLTRGDIEIVKAQKHEGNISQVSKLLDLLQTRTDGFETLIYALQSTGQTDALALLTPGEEASSSPLPESSRTPSTSSNVSETTRGGQMASLIVGKQNCSFIDVVEVIESSLAFIQFITNEWRKLGGKMDVGPTDLKTFDDHLMYNRRKPLEIFEEMLFIWRNTMGDDATLDVLIEIFQKCGSKAIADRLKKRFSG